MRLSRVAARAALLLLSLGGPPALGAPNSLEAASFSAPITVTRAHGAKTFHHLESAGRTNIAVSDGHVAVIWEDDRSGVAQIYAALKPTDSDAFTRELLLSAGKASTEPALTALSGGRFVAAWEEDGKVWLRAFDANGLRDHALVATQARQLALTARNDTLHVAWAQQQGRASRILYARARLNDDIITVTPAQTVARSKTQSQWYPSLVVSASGAVTIAWEDRRHGYTRIYTANSAKGTLFKSAQALNAAAPRTATVGRGTGAARPVLTTYGARGVAAVWLDKRDFPSGYDVYSALSPAGDGRFGGNLRVQDEFGADISQWHATVAGDARGRLVAFWDDDRDEHANIWLAQWNGEKWSENVALTIVAGVATQTSPSVALGNDGLLHLVWIAQSPQGESRIHYSRAQFPAP